MTITDGLAQMKGENPVFPLDTYYDPVSGRPLTSDDGCSLEEWLKGTSSARFGIHSNGFPVFLAPSEIAAKDEYQDHDPYHVMGESGEPTQFHKRRLTGTLRLLNDAIQEEQRELRILDLGCGAGHFTAEIKSRIPLSRVCGLDCSLSGIVAANERYASIDFAVGDANTLPYSKDSFDIVVCNNIWEHVPDPLRMLESIKRVLKTDGFVIISTPSRYRLANLARVLMGKPVKFISRHHVTEYSVGQVIEQLRFGGFEAKVYNEPLRQPASGLSGFIGRKIVGPLIRGYLKLVHSHHSLEWTVFFIARRLG